MQPTAFGTGENRQSGLAGEMLSFCWTAFTVLPVQYSKIGVSQCPNRCNGGQGVDSQATSKRQIDAAGEL